MDDFLSSIGIIVFAIGIWGWGFASSTCQSEEYCKRSHPIVIGEDVYRCVKDIK